VSFVGISLCVVKPFNAGPGRIHRSEGTETRHRAEAEARRLDYEMWLGSTPHVYSTEKRVHPQEGYDRPGWLGCEPFGAGMITGWRR